MNWIINSEYQEFEELINKEALSESEEYRLMELENNIEYYNRTYGG